MRNGKHFEAWRFYHQPEYFADVWRQLELNLPGNYAPGEVEILPGPGRERCYHIRHHYRHPQTPHQSGRS